MILLYVHTFPSLPWVGGITFGLVYSSLDRDFIKQCIFKGRKDKHNHAKIHTFHPPRPTPRYRTLLVIEPSIPPPNP